MIVIWLFIPVCHCHKVVFSITGVVHGSRAVCIEVDKALNSLCRTDKIDFGSSAHGCMCPFECVAKYTHTHTQQDNDTQMCVK